MQKKEITARKLANPVDKISAYLEKRIRETEKLISRLKSHRTDWDDDLGIGSQQGELRSLRTTLKYVRSARVKK